MHPKSSYTQRLKAIFGSSLIAYFPLWEPSGTVVTDIGGASRHGTYGAGAAAPTLAQPGALNGTCPSFDGGDYASVFTTGLRDAFNGSLGTLMAWVKLTEAAYTELSYRKVTRITLNTSNRVEIEHSGSNTDTMTFTYRAGGTSKSATLAQISSLWAGWLHLAITWNHDSDRVRGFVNGVQVGADLTGLGDWTASPLTSAIIGASSNVPAEPWLGWLQHLAIGNTELTPTQVSLVYGSFPRKLIVFEGDSRTTGTGAAVQALNYPRVAARKLTGNWKCANVGDSGQTVATMLAEISELDIADPGLGRVAVLWGGVNDNTTASTMHNRIIAWCNAARAKGYKVIVCTEIDCQAASHADWHSTNYQALNVLIRANYTAYADGLADLGGNANLQDATNVTYFAADKTHLIEAGYAEVAVLVAAAINAL